MTASHFVSISPQDHLLARFPWPVAAGLSLLVLLAALVQSFRPTNLDSLFLVPANLSFAHFWPIWTGHFAQPDSLYLAILGSTVAALFAVELETRMGSINLLQLLLFICPVISLIWVGLEIGADKLGLLSATLIPLSSHPLITFLVAVRTMVHPGHYLLATGYRLRTWVASTVYSIILVGTLLDAGTWAIFLPAHLVAWVLGTIVVALIHRKETTLLNHLQTSSRSQILTDDSKPNPHEDDWRDRLDHVLAAVAVHGLDGLSWDDWRFLRATSRRLRRS